MRHGRIGVPSTCLAPRVLRSTTSSSAPTGAAEKRGKGMAKRPLIATVDRVSAGTGCCVVCVVEDRVSESY